MILDPRPKTSRSELYGRSRELFTLAEYVIKHKVTITIVGGVRGVGKTSLVLTAASEVGDRDFLYIYVEGRWLRRRGRLAEVLAEKLGVGGAEGPVSVLERARGLGRHVVVVIEEPQEAARSVYWEYVDLAEAIAYNTLRHVSLIVPSSAPGLAKEAIGIERVGTRIYGYNGGYEMWVDPLDPGDAEEMLMDGLREQGMSPDPDTVREAVEFFGAIPGWLVFFGQRLLAGMRPEQIYREAVETALEEIKKLAPRPQLILKVLAEGNNSWKEAIEALEDLEERRVSRNGFAKAVRYLEKRALVRNYRILDPVYERAARLLDPREPLARLGLPVDEYPAR